MPAPKTVTIHGQTATLFRDGPHPGYLAPDGKFCVEWGGRWVKKATLQTIDRLVQAGRPTVRLFTVSTSLTFYSNNAEVVDAAEWHDNKLVTADGKRVFKRKYDDYFVADDETLAKLADLNRRRAEADRKFQEELTKIMKGVKLVRDEKGFKAAVKAAVKAAAEAARADPEQAAADAVTPKLGRSFVRREDGGTA
jgi:hypothetical protein